MNKLAVRRRFWSRLVAEKPVYFSSSGRYLLFVLMVMESGSGSRDLTMGDFELFFLKSLTTESKVKKLMKEAKIFTKIKYSAGMDNSLGRSFANFVVASDRLQLLSGNFCYQVEKRPYGYLTEMKHRDFQSKIESLFGKTDTKFYFRVTSNNDKLIPMNLNPDQMIAITGFSFGSLIEMHTFVDHVDFGKYSNKLSGMRMSMFKRDLFVRFLNGKNKVAINFKLYSPGTQGLSSPGFQQHYRFSLDYDGINFVTVAPGQEKDQNGRFVKFLDVVICYLKSPLLHFFTITDGDNMKPQRYKEDYKSDELEERRAGNWIRCLTIPGVDNDTFGRSTAIRLRLPSVKEYQYEKVRDLVQTDPLDILSCLSYFAGCPIYWSKIDAIPAQPSFELQSLVKGLKEMQSDTKAHTSGQILRSKPYVEYALNGIFSLSHYVSDFLNMDPEGGKPGDRKKKFCKMIRTCAFINPKALEESLYDCFRLLNRTSALDVMQFLPDRFARLTGDNAEARTRIADPIENVKMVRRVYITPSRVICTPPEPTLASWFLRRLQDDCLIRIYFRDENMNSYTFTCNTHHRNSSPFGEPAWKSMLKKRVFAPVVDGLLLASKKFEFLVCSSSMMRSHALLMYAKDGDGRDAASYQKEIGDLTKIKTVAKHIARSGQAVSQAIGRIPVAPSLVDFEYPDVQKVDEKTRLVKYTFTDGIGMISSELAKEIAAKMKWKMIPSAFQIRYGGAKGVVAVDPNLPDKNGKHLFLRQSMVKFPSESDSLEILKPSLLRPVHLNKSFIMALDQLGVPEDVFVKLLLKELNAACAAFLSESEATATLKTYSALHVPLRIRQILDGESNINVLREPFFRKCMAVVTNEMVTELKSKARIKIPMDVGRHMLGVTDESRTLEEGEVFVQYTQYHSYFSSDPQDIRCEILEGEILVTKAPTMVVGDARKFKAVNIPALHHHRDVIVFSQKGGRPDPDKMAGSDLDGDEYVVIWFKPLIFEGGNQPPLDYDTPGKKTKEKEITTASIMDVFQQYMERDSVGLIATTHLARSDRDKDGSDEVNLRLALKYTKSLDAPKTGDYQSLKPEEMAMIHPDYMGKEAHGPSYVSERILGTIYRQVCLYEMAICDYVTVQPLQQANQLLVHKDWEKFKSSAEASHRKYSAMIHSLLKQYRVADEAALLTQSFAGQSNGRELRDFRKTIDVQVKEIMNAMREDFEKEFSDMPDSSAKEKSDKESMKQAKASAWYMVTQEASLRETDSPMMALPWIVGNYLADLSNEDSSLPRSNPISIIQEMSDQLDKKIAIEAILSFEERFEEATKILTNWMEYQGHLQFMSSKKVNEALSEMHSVLCDIRRGYEVNPDLELPSVGYVVILTMIQMAKIVLDRTSVRGFSHETYEIEADLNFSFLSSLVKLFRSGDADHILTDQYPMPKAAASFYLGIESKYTDSFEKFNMYKFDFHRILKSLTGIDDVESSFENHGRKVRINAYGYKWNLIQLRMILSQDKFLATLLDRLDGRHQKMVIESGQSLN